MPNYDHHKKSGNQGDIVKHPSLIAAVDAIVALMDKEKDTFHYADTFAAYAWNPLVEGHEWKQGIGRIADSPSLHQDPNTKIWKERYLTPSPILGSIYPGSASIVCDLCNSREVKIKMALWDIAPEPIESLKNEFGDSNHNIHEQAADVNDKDIKNADFVFIDPPDKNCWSTIFRFLNEAPENQSILVWLPVTANTFTSPPSEDQPSKDIRDQVLGLSGFQVSKIRWALGGRTIGCQLLYRLPDLAVTALHKAANCIVTAADWKDDIGFLGIKHYDSNGSV